MRNKYKNIIVKNARNYSNNTDISFLGALLKTSIIPFDLLDRYISDRAKILDLGCGEGMFSNSLSLLLPNAQIYGVDLDAEKIRKAQACKLRNVVFTEGDAHKFEFERADAVIFNDMLHHNAHF